jgi:2-methylcitrate dehydratase
MSFWPGEVIKNAGWDGMWNTLLAIVGGCAALPDGRLENAMTLANRIATFSTSLSWEDLPQEVIDSAVRAIADTLACAIGASNQPSVNLLKEYALARSGRQSSTLVGSGEKVDPVLATLVNATAARDLDANDLYATAPGRDTGHFSDAIPALLAIAEQYGSSGRDLILATVVAYEIQAALAEGYLWMDRGLHAVSQVAWAVPAAGGRLMGLTENEIVNAIGPAGSTGGLILQSWLKPSRSIPMLKGASAGFAAMRGVEAAELARAGFTAPPDALETLFDRLESDADLSRFGRLENRDEFAITRTIIKRYPAQIYIQAAVEAAIHLSGKISSVDDIAVATLYGHRNVAAGVQGSGAAYTPETREAADHSTPFVVAMALRDGDLTPATYEGEPWRDDELLDLMRRIDLVIDPDLDAMFDREGKLGCRLLVEMIDGTVFETTVDQPEGHPDRPMSREALLAKIDGLLDLGAARCSGSSLLKLCESSPESSTPIELLAAIERHGASRT